jgi:hypothetical protein
MNRATKTRVPPIVLGLLAFTLIVMVSHGCTTNKPPAEKEGAQLSFTSPDDALQALVTAIRAQDTDKLKQIFGPGSDDLLFSGDPVDDQLTFDRFISAYDQKHQLVTNDDGSVTIVVGNDDWPLPIPIVKDESGKAWLFDTANGKDEVITRRIGRNELTVIEVCKAICDAQRDYAHRDPNNDSIPEYARKFISDPGKTNGLYWPTAADEQPSPLGAAVAEAQGEGYSTDPNSADPNSTDKPRPYHGYLYRILTAQGADAPGGATDYIINGKFIGGFAVVAWPVNYGSSGIMTFITNYSGEVYQKDLGDDTDKLARAITEYNPDATWKKAE